jgi:hypothetical protein
MPPATKRRYPSQAVSLSQAGSPGGPTAQERSRGTPGRWRGHHVHPAHRSGCRLDAPLRRNPLTFGASRHGRTGGEPERLVSARMDTDWVDRGGGGEIGREGLGFLVRTAAPVNALLAPWPIPVVVVDTNVLLRSACYVAARGIPPLLARLALTGRAPLFIAPHVLDEFGERLPRVAGQQRVSPNDARQALADHLLPHLRVVEMTVSDHLRPEIAAIRRRDGDPDDLPTASLAALLSPSVIVSADGVFARLGLAAVGDWIPIAWNVLQVAGYEASFADAVLCTDLLGRLLGAAGRQAWHLVTSHPRLALAAAVSMMTLGAAGRLPARPSLEGVQRLGRSSVPLIERLAAAASRHQRSRSELLLVEDPPWREPTLTELCARHLARCPEPQTATELRDALNSSRLLGPRPISAAACRRAMTHHPAFVRAQRDRFWVGTTAPLGLRPY